MRNEIIRIADRLDDIKSQLGGMGDTRAIRALEEKLVTVAAALEHIGAHIDPNERMVMEQFSSLDMRLDEITRAIAAGSRNTGPGNDPATFHRLEERLSGLARQIEGLSQFRAPQYDASREMAERLEHLTARIEQLSAEQGAMRIEERLEQLSYMLEKVQRPGAAPELTAISPISPARSTRSTAALSATGSRTDWKSSPSGSRNSTSHSHSRSQSSMTVPFATWKTA